MSTLIRDGVVFKLGRRVRRLYNIKTTLGEHCITFFTRMDHITDTRRVTSEFTVFFLWLRIHSIICQIEQSLTNIILK